MKIYEFERSSELNASPSLLWDAAVTPANINREFRPVLRMTFPNDTRRITEPLVLNQTIFRSWLLLFGVLPIEYDDLAFSEIVEGQMFHEKSSMFFVRTWEHIRCITPVECGSRLTDTIRFEPKVRVLGPAQMQLFKLVFKLRHTNLVKTYGKLITTETATTGSAQPPITPP
tara:strand:- start:8375 stop:8890 length:516 start_codon:yes stop_codon:yes gene_type:complete